MARYVGNRNPNTRYGTAEADYFEGRGGDDVLYGRGGNDQLFGNSGSDRLYGQGGNDAIFGGDGADFIFGGIGDDRLFGGGGNDRIAGGAGRDGLSGGSGADTLVFDDNGGKDKVHGFQNGADKFDLSAVAAVDGFADLTRTQRDDGVVVDYGSGSFLVVNALKSQIDADDFLF